MTTRREAENALFINATLTVSYDPKAETSTNVGNPDRRRVDATYCPLCQSWVEVRLNPIRLHCTGCGVEAKP